MAVNSGSMRGSHNSFWAGTPSAKSSTRKIMKRAKKMNVKATDLKKKDEAVSKAVYILYIVPDAVHISQRNIRREVCDQSV